MKLELGYNHSFDIRTECCVLHGVQCSLLYLSDFHFNRFSGAITEKIIEAVEVLNPSIILLGGDYADTQRGLIHLNRLLAALSQRPHVVAIAGNHDYFFGLRRIRQLMLRYGVQWIEKTVVVFDLGGKRIQIAGNQPDNRLDGVDLSVLCLHRPIDITRFKDDYDIIFAGHLHGSQVVLWQRGDALYPGRWFYTWNILKTRLQTCHYFISKGLGDTLPLRYNCRRDMLFVKIVGEH